MTDEQIGEILFWLLAAALLMALLGLFLGIRVRVPARALVALLGSTVAAGLWSWAVVTLPAETIGGWLTWGSLGGMFFGLFWALTRGK